jgi:hypothetical protein
LVIFDFVPEFVNDFLSDSGGGLNLEHVEAATSYPVTFPKNVTHRFHNLHEIIFAEYNMPVNEMIPLDADLVREMAPFESMALRCLDKLEKPSILMRHIADLDGKDRLHATVFGHEVSYLTRKQIYLQHLRFWNHVITTERINLFICTNIPHVGADFVLYGLCKVKGIPVITFEATLVGRVITKEDVLQSDRRIGEAYQELLTSLGTEKDVELFLPTETFYRFYSDANTDPAPVYMGQPGFGGFIFHQYGFTQGLRRFVPQLIKGLFTTRRFRKIFSQLFIEMSYGRKTRALQTFYDRISADPLPGEKYIYLALHVQPELSTAPLASIFVDQLNIINMISHLLPDDMKLYVKEHPAQPCISRNIEFYSELVKNPKVKIIRRSANTFRLIDNAVAVATCTGTVGLESLFKGKPVLTFGSAFYDQAPGCFRIDSKDDLKAALDVIFSKNAGPSLRELRLFLKAFELNSYPGHLMPLDDEKRTRFCLSDQDVVMGLKQAIRAKLSEIESREP